MEDILTLAKEFEYEKNYIFLIIGGGAKYEKVYSEAQMLENVTVLPYQSF